MCVDRPRLWRSYFPSRLSVTWRITENKVHRKYIQNRYHYLLEVFKDKTGCQLCFLSRFFESDAMLVLVAKAHVNNESNREATPFIPWAPEVFLIERKFQ